MIAALIDGTAQAIFYDEGVGTRKGEKLLGGLFGHGIVQNLGDAYRFLIFNHTPGDEIYVFGFSRGAYTARSFAGLLSTCGLLRRGDAAKVTDAVVVLRNPKLVGEKLTFDVVVLEGSLGDADGPASVFIDTIWFGLGSNGFTYLGQNQTTGGTSPAIGSVHDTSTFSGWSNPAPDGRPQPPPATYRPPCGTLPYPPCN